VSFVAQVLAVSYDTNSPSGGRQITMLDVSPLMPFLQMSENFLNLVYCFALGYFVSFIVMLVRIYRGVEQAVRVIASRPLLGGLCAACLYVLSIAATDLLLEQRGDFRFGSLPAMALIGALSVERFDRLLRSLDKR
jgi:hypothetical protein